MIQEKPVCFGCELPIDDPQQVVYAPPFVDDLASISAVFHGLCLMSWRERRAEVRERMRQAREAWQQAVQRHLDGECGC